MKELSRELIKTDRNGTKYYKVRTVCEKCGGKGIIDMFYFNDRGRCFDCNGSGVTEHTEKVMLPQYEAKLIARRKARQEKKIQEIVAKSEETNKEFFRRQGYNEEGKTYAVLGNTYEIKEQLKELGCKWDNSIGWHSPSKLEGYKTFEVDVDEMFIRNEVTNTYDWRDIKVSEEMIERLNKSNDELRRNLSTSEYIAEIGEKVETEVKLNKSYCFETQFYNTCNYIYNFSDMNGNTVVWKTSKYLGLNEGDTVKITGKVKELTEYKGTKQTVLTRCKVTK